jgi:ABC-type Fe3+-hydroxamate transport system substrate-binding protein
MVKQSMEMLIKKYKPDVIIFTAGKEDKSRASLYQRMLKKFLKWYSIESYDKNKYQIQFKLERL